MRWLFVGVVVLNLLYFGWRLASPDDVVAETVGMDEPQPFPAGLALLAEGGAAGAPVVPLAGTPSTPSLSGCPAVGPWGSTDEARRVVESLVAAGVKADVRAVELKGAKVYWVYLAPFAERAQAMRKLRELQAKGIDSFVVSGGGDANAISLGSFTARDSALGIQSRLRGAGYAADIREQQRDLQQTWVVLRDPAAQGYLEYVPADLRDRSRQERLSCN